MSMSRHMICIYYDSITVNGKYIHIFLDLQQENLSTNLQIQSCNLNSFKLKTRWSHAAIFFTDTAHYD